MVNTIKCILSFQYRMNLGIDSFPHYGAISSRPNH